MGAGESKEALNQRIHARLDTVRTNYAAFLRRHPDSARGYLAYGSFLDDIGDEDAGKVQFENAAQADPKNPAAWNNLANYYGENGGLTNAFTDYARAIELDPTEPVYYQNLATTVYLYRKDARAFYGINEQQVFDKALALYQKAVQLDPDNFVLATDYAETYYGIRPLRTNDALVAWTNALNIAHTDVQREGVFIHLARLKIAAGFFNEARAQLAAVTNDFYADLKNSLERNLVERENPPRRIRARGDKQRHVSTKLKKMFWPTPQEPFLARTGNSDVHMDTVRILTSPIDSTSERFESGRPTRRAAAGVNVTR